MKVLPFTIPKPKKDSLILQDDVEDIFYPFLHQHEELQISLIKQGKGSLLVGDRVTHYWPNTFIVLGSNLPHVFKSLENNAQKSIMRSIFFTENAFGEDFFNTEELKVLRQFFVKAEYGFIVENVSENLQKQFEMLFKRSKFERFLHFLSFLKALNSEKANPLSNFAFKKKYTDLEGRRMSAVFEFILNNFKQKITLFEVAEKASMTPNAFCSFFKKRTRKTVTEFVNELRIEEACLLLASKNDLSISDISELSGFNNLSNFNRKFKETKGTTPLKFGKVSISPNSLP